MRFFEFAVKVDTVDRFVTVLKNYVGQSQSANKPAKLNWRGLTQIAHGNGIKVNLDYETFKTLYDSVPLLQKITKNFNANGVELEVPGVADEKESPPEEKSQDAVDQIAASNAEKNLNPQM
jgi:hypothetical protein